MFHDKVLTRVFCMIFIIWAISRCLSWKWHALCVIARFYSTLILNSFRSYVCTSKILEKVFTYLGFIMFNYIIFALTSCLFQIVSFADLNSWYVKRSSSQVVSKLLVLWYRFSNSAKIFCIDSSISAVCFKWL